MKRFGKHDINLAVRGGTQAVKYPPVWPASP